jgi:hypothetical protein
MLAVGNAREHLTGEFNNLKQTMSDLLRNPTLSAQLKGCLLLIDNIHSLELEELTGFSVLEELANYCQTIENAKRGFTQTH